MHLRGRDRLPPARREEGRNARDPRVPGRRGRVPRSTSDEVTLFDSTGTALQDVAAAAVVYEKAMDAGKGLLLDFAG